MWNGWSRQNLIPWYSVSSRHITTETHNNVRPSDNSIPCSRRPEEAWTERDLVVQARVMQMLSTDDAHIVLLNSYQNNRCVWILCRKPWLSPYPHFWNIFDESCKHRFGIPCISISYYPYLCVVDSCLNKTTINSLWLSWRSQHRFEKSTIDLEPN